MLNFILQFQDSQSDVPAQYVQQNLQGNCYSPVHGEKFQDYLSVILRLCLVMVQVFIQDVLVFSHVALEQVSHSCS